MTDREKAIVMAYTGICMLAGDKFQIFHKYVEDIMGRPIWTHEMGIETIADEIKTKSRDDFIALCADESSSENPNKCKVEEEQDGDMISRDAVIDITWEEPSYTDALNVLTEVRDKVKALPSVNPQPCEDAISRQAVLDEINSIGVKGFETYNDYSQLYDFVDTLSSVNPQEPKADVLDKIRTEIDAHRETLKIMADDDWYAGKIRGYDCAIEIIDKYKAESEVMK